MADDPQNPTEWVPSAKQADLLRTAGEPGLKRSISAICKRAGVDRSSYYDWMKNDPSFRAAWNRLWSETIRNHMPGIAAAVVYKALKGNIAASRLASELEGLIKKRVEVTGKDGEPVNVVDYASLTPEQIATIRALKKGSSSNGP